MKVSSGLRAVIAASAAAENQEHHEQGRERETANRESTHSFTSSSALGRQKGGERRDGTWRSGVRCRGNFNRPQASALPLNDSAHRGDSRLRMAWSSRTASRGPVVASFEGSSPMQQALPRARTGVKIAAVGRALPPHYYDQQTLLAALASRWAERMFNLDRLERLHRNVLVGGRHLALPIEEYAGLTTWGRANDAWIRVAQEVGEAAVRDALERAGVAPAEVDALLFVTVTGVATPSIDAPDEPARPGSARQAHADFRPRMRRRRCRHLPRRRLRPRLPGSGRGPALRRGSAR